MPKRIIFISIAVVFTAVSAAAVFIFKKDKGLPSSGSRYISYTGKYVFDVPQNFSVDEKSVADVQLVYPSSQQINANSIDEAYLQGIVSVQAMNISDSSEKGFKSFIEGGFSESLKKITPDIKIAYAKKDKLDIAKVTARKDGKIVRFSYFINAKHPVVITGPVESAAVKSIVQTINNIEDSGLNEEQKKMKQAIDDALLFIKAPKAQELYNNSSKELKGTSSVSDIDSALRKASERMKNALTFYGVLYSGNAFSVGLNFWEPSKNQTAPTAFGNLVFIKEDGAWRLQQMVLPTT